MTITMLEMHIWKYWLTSTESGFDKEVKLFANKANAKKVVADYNANPYYIDAAGNKVPLDGKENRKAYFITREVEVEDI